MIMLIIENIRQLVTCANKSSFSKSGKKMSDIGLIENGNVLISDDKIFLPGIMTIKGLY